MAFTPFTKGGGKKKPAPTNAQAQDPKARLDVVMKGLKGRQ